MCIRDRCEVPYLAFMCALKGDRPEPYEPPDKDKDKEIFDDFDGVNFIWTKQEDVSKSVETNKFLASSYVTGEFKPRLISFESSTGSLRDGKWQQNSVGNKRLPLTLMEDCFTDEVKTKVKNRIHEAATQGNEEVKAYEAREELGTLGIICGTYFKTTSDLHRHLSLIHISEPTRPY